MTPMPRVWLPALLSAALTYLCFFPANLGFLAWVAVVPWFALAAANRPRAFGLYAACFVVSFLGYLAMLQWIRVADDAMYAAWAALAVFCAGNAVVALFLTRRLTRAGVPLWLAGAVAVTAVDYFKCHFTTGYTWMQPLGWWQPIGFGWYFLGYSQHDSPALIQIADLAGVYGVTFVVVMVNGVLFTLVARVSPVRRALRMAEPPPVSRTGLITAAALLAACLGYGVWRLNQGPFADGPEVALIQGNLPQDVKNTHGPEMAQHFKELCDQAVAVRPLPDLVVWPETSFTWTWHDTAPGVDEAQAPIAFRKNIREGRLILREAADYWHTPMFYGMNRIEWESPQRTWYYNSAVLADRNGTPLGTYDKTHLVPFGEYVPFVGTLPFLKKFSPYGDEGYGCRAGRRLTKFPLAVPSGEYTFGCLICYEDTDPGLARQYVAGPGPVDFFVNISNDGWFNGTEQHEEHLAISRFRAVESRRSIVRAVNMGVSAIIDPAGRIVALPGDSWAHSKKVSAVLRGRVPVGTQWSLYAAVGDWLALACWVFVVIGLIRGSRFFRRPGPPIAT